MNKLISLVAGFILALTLFVTTPEAATSGGLYDMSRFLQEPHPFERTPVFPRLSLEKPLVPPKIIVPNKKDLNVISSTKKPAELIKTPKVLLPSTTSKYTPISKPGYLSEIRGGILVHDEGPFSRNKEDGIDTNIEVLFKSPSMFDVVYSPRPHLGATLNSAGNTSQAYLGLTWDWDFYRYFFLNFSLGGAFHTGEKVTDDPKTKSLGCSVLFRESLDLGYKVSGPHSVMFHLDHISNAKLCSTNEGLEAFGLRYGYSF